MTTRFKLNIASFFVCVVGFANTSSYILGIPEAGQWALLIVIWVPLGLVFYYFKKLKKERAEAIASGVLALSKVADEESKGRKKLILTWVCMFPFTMSFPFWLPTVSGVSLGHLGDFLTAFGSFLMLSLVFWLRLKKKPNQLPDPTSPSVTPPAGAGGAPSGAADH
jgi:FtsH-binding integral membrane protein